MKKILFVIVIVLSLFGSAKADVIQEEIEKLSEENIVQIDRFVKEINQKTGSDFLIVDLKTYLLQVLKGQQPFDLNKIFAGILKLFFKELYSSFNLLIQLLVLGVIGSILMNLHSSFEKESVSEIAFLAIYLIFIIIA
ncbi:MAG: stage III sporulation protein AE, partial [Caldanaerobacter sp.]